MLRTSTVLAFSLALCATVSAQESHTRTFTNSLGQIVEESAATDFKITPPLSEWPEVNDADMRDGDKREVDHQRTPPAVVNPNALPHGMDPALQLVPASRPANTNRAPVVNFNGQSGSGMPPDPTGAAGPNHYLQAVNTAFRVYNKTGSSIGAAHNLNFLWSGSADEGDPIVLYDRHADRWFISQFNSGPNRMLLAVSQTSDPTGAYYSWSFNFGNTFPDYPKLSIWWDGYYMTSNSSKTTVAFQRDAMLNGVATAKMVSVTSPNLITNGFHSMLSADADGDLPPAGTPCYFFNMEDDSWGAPTDRLRVYEMHVDWVTTANSTVTLTHTLNTAPFDNNFPGSWNDIAQPGTTQKLDAIAGCLNFRAQHTRWVDHSSVVLSNVVDVNGADHAGIRWYELRDGNDGNWSIYQQGTYSPDAAHRWIPSIAMDNMGNIGLAYCFSDPANSLYPGLRYTGRSASDPLGQMTIAETVAIAGGGSQFYSVDPNYNRYGDYGQLSLDPNGSTFWHTGEYLGPGGSIRTRIYSFNIATNVGIDEHSANAVDNSLHAVLNDRTLQVSIEGLRGDEAMSFDIIGADGKQVRTMNVRPADGKWAAPVDVHDLVPGIWFARVGNSVFQKVQRFVIAQ